MKTNYLKRSMRSVACLLLALVLFTGSALPAYASDSNKPKKDGDVIVITTDDEATIRELLKGSDMPEEYIQMVVRAAKKADPSTPVIIVSTNDENKIHERLKSAGMTEEYIQAIVKTVETADLSAPLVITRKVNAKLTKLPDIYQTTTDAEKVTETHLKTDWAELDWTTANDGYVKIKWTKKLVDHAYCTVRWVEDGAENFINYPLNKDVNFDQWFKIPLAAGNTEYAVSIDLCYTEDDLSNDKSDEELDAIWRDLLQARFKPEMKDEDAWMLLSSIRADFDNAPETCKKAKELTKDCKTDAEKITAIVKYVAKTIKYDHNLYNNEKKREADKEDLVMIGCDRDLNPDHILKAKKGVCEHYAVLATAMLRSIGIPCQTVSGWSTSSTGTVERHAWILVKPKTGTLNVKALAGGKDPNSDWIRLDPTNMLTAPKTTSNDKNYSPDRYN